jgi:hypothetical protein
MSNFRAIDRETGFLLPPSIDEWLPEKHLARFVVEVIDARPSRWPGRLMVVARPARAAAEWHKDCQMQGGNCATWIAKAC